MSLADIPTALAALAAGKPVIVADDEGRENEGDVVLAAQFASQEWIAWTVRHTSGYLCAPMTNEIADRLDLPLMVAASQDWRGTAYTVSVDAADRLSTGISASDRAHTLRVLADGAATPDSLIRPGHILPLRAVDGGVRERDGHTEATVSCEASSAEMITSPSFSRPSSSATMIGRPARSASSATGISDRLISSPPAPAS